MGKPSNRFELKQLAWVVLALVALAVVWAATVVVEHVRYERATFNPVRGASHHPPQAPFDRLTDVYLDYRDGRLAAWYAAPLGQKVVVVVAHGSMGSREHMLDEIDALLQPGFGVLAFDFPGHGESDGKIDCVDQPNVVLAAVREAQRQAPGARVAALGYSMGAYAVVTAAARDPVIAAVVSIGGFADAYEQTLYEHRSRGWLSQMAAVQTDAWYGVDLKALRPLVDIENIAPRPVFIVHGRGDDIVPVEQAKRLFAAAREPKELWLIEKAGHGHYRQAANEQYASRLADFLNRRMLQVP